MKEKDWDHYAMKWEGSRVALRSGLGPWPGFCSPTSPFVKMAATLTPIRSESQVLGPAVPSRPPAVPSNTTTTSATTPSKRSNQPTPATKSSAAPNVDRKPVVVSEAPPPPPRNPAVGLNPSLREADLLTYLWSSDEVKVFSEEGEEDAKESASVQELHAALLEEKSSLIQETEELIGIKEEGGGGGSLRRRLCNIPDVPGKKEITSGHWAFPKEIWILVLPIHFNYRIQLVPVQFRHILSIILSAFPITDQLREKSVKKPVWLIAKNIAWSVKGNFFTRTFRQDDDFQGFKIVFFLYSSVNLSVLLRFVLYLLSGHSLYSKKFVLIIQTKWFGWSIPTFSAAAVARRQHCR